MLFFEIDKFSNCVNSEINDGKKDIMVCILHGIMCRSLQSV